MSLTSFMSQQSFKGFVMIMIYRGITRARCMEYVDKKKKMNIFLQ